jgi:hypothetical protein
VDALAGQEPPQICGDRSAHQFLDAQAGQGLRPFHGLIRDQSRDCFRADGTVFNLGDQDPLGGVEDRCDPVFQECERDFHAESFLDCLQ